MEFWQKLDEIISTIRKVEKLILGENGYVGRAYEKYMSVLGGGFQFRQRKEEILIVTTYFEKKDEQWISFKSGNSFFLVKQIFYRFKYLGFIHRHDYYQAIFVSTLCDWVHELDFII